MSIYPITSAAPACYGLGCPEHHRCARYHLVPDVPVHRTIGTCADAHGHPLFVLQTNPPALASTPAQA